MKSRYLYAKSAAALILLSATYASGALASSPDDSLGWPTFNNSYDGGRFSALKEINVKNVATLKRVCELKLGELGRFQTGPIVVGAVMYFSTPTATFAIDATNCKLHWRSDYEYEERPVDTTNKGVAYYDGKIFRGMPDGRIVALDAATGKEIWRIKAGNSEVGEYFGAAPIVWNGLVFIGTAGSDYGVKSRMLAIDAETGREVWRFNLIPDPDEPGGDTWSGPAKRAGAATWTTYSLDTDTGELMIPASNPSPALRPGDRPGDNLFTNSVVVLDAKSGKLKWYYQITPHDPWDYDLAAAPIFYTDRLGRSIVAAGSKDGNVYFIDRYKHQLIGKTPVSFINDPAPQATAEGVRKCPGFVGGVQWNGPAHDTGRHLVFVGSTEWCMIYKTTGVTASTDPSDLPRGWVTAIDDTSGEVVWRYGADDRVLAGVTATAGEVLMTGDNAGNFLVFNEKNGNLLVKRNIGGSMAGGVITYQVANKQYVAVTSGSISRGSFVKTTGVPKVVIMTLGLSKDEPAIVKASSDIDFAREHQTAEDRIAHGHRLFDQVCSVCHGVNGEGLSGPPVKGLKRSPAKFETAIKMPKPPMPKLYPQLLKNSDVYDLIEFLSQWKN